MTDLAQESSPPAAPGDGGEEGSWRKGPTAAGASKPGSWPLESADLSSQDQRQALLLPLISQAVFCCSWSAGESRTNRL